MRRARDGGGDVDVKHGVPAVMDSPLGVERMDTNDDRGKWGGGRKRAIPSSDFITSSFLRWETNVCFGGWMIPIRVTSVRVDVSGCTYFENEFSKYDLVGRL